MERARGYLDYQERMIGEFCRISHETGGWEAPHYPPSDVTRRYPRLFDQWVREQTRRRDQKYGDQKQKKTSYEYLWTDESGRFLDDSALAKRKEDRVFVFWCGEEGCDVGYDWWGRRVRGSMV